MAWRRIIKMKGRKVSTGIVFMVVGLFLNISMFATFLGHDTPNLQLHVIDGYCFYSDHNDTAEYVDVAITNLNLSETIYDKTTEEGYYSVAVGTWGEPGTQDWEEGHLLLVTATGNVSLGYGGWFGYSTGIIQKTLVTINVTLTLPPEADFKYSPSGINAIKFTDLSYDSDGIIVNYTWNFGDGSIAYGSTVTHRFVDDGTYNVTLVITDDDGATATITKNITVANVPPVADFIWQPANPTDLDEIIFDAYPSYDSDGKIVKWQWDLGDGNKSSGRIVRHKYAVNGLYKVKLTIVDDDGATVTKTKSIMVSNIPPVANFTWQPTNPTDLDKVLFTSTSYDSDGAIVNYTWNFGDGNISYKQNPIHTYSNYGLYDVTLTVRDDKGWITNISKKINITLPPLPTRENPPTDPDRDRLFEDLNGNGLIDFDDVVEFFKYFEWIENNYGVNLVDFNLNGGIDFDDVVELFREVEE